VDFELDQDQKAIVEAVGSLLEQYAGASRNIALAAKAEYDSALQSALTTAGFSHVARGEDTGPLEAALVVEAVARHGGVVAIGAQALVAPGVTQRDLPSPIALVDSEAPGPARFAAHAQTLLVAAGDEARVVFPKAGEVEAVPSNFGYPMGRPRPECLQRGETLGSGSGERLRDWWRTALAVEAVGCMGAALEITLDYVKHRRQFGRAIGSFQAVQHRLAECSVLLEGSRWLAHYAASRGANREEAAVAAAFSLASADRIFVDTHQLSGAIGFTRGHDLHVWSMRLQALRLELGGVSAHRRVLSRARWCAAR
jgi:alkylation response protein AidB-like acyl-CoA dehydrogenase